MAAPILRPLDVQAPLGTPAAEWAQQTFDAIDPNTNTGPTTGLVTDAHGNPTADHAASALGGAPGHGVYADKTQAHMEAVAAHAPKATDPIPLKTETSAPAAVEGAAAGAPTGAGLFTDAHGNPTTDPNASALAGIPGDGPMAGPRGSAPGAVEGTTTGVPKSGGLFTDARGNPTIDPNASALAGVPGDGSMAEPNSSVPATPGVQLPGGWIRPAGSRASTIGPPQTSLYEDVSSALGTVGQAAFSALPASVIGNLSNNREQGGANPTAHANGSAPASGELDKSALPPTGSPGLLSRAQGMFSGLLARPASPAPNLPAPDAPTTTGDAALVGGGAVAQTANILGNNIASGQELGGHEPKGVLAGEYAKSLEAEKLEKEGAGRAISPESANTAARFLDAGVATPDVEKPPQDPGFSGSVFPALADDPKKDKSKVKAAPPASTTSPTSTSGPGATLSPATASGALGSTISPDSDVQAAARRSNQDFSSAIPTPGGPDAGSKSPASAEESDRPVPKVTKVSDSGVLGRILDVKDVVSAPFAGSRAPKESDALASPGSPGKKDLPSPALGTAHVDQHVKSSANAEGIRTTENPHTAHTRLAPAKEEGTHVGGTGIVGNGNGTSTGGADRKDLDGSKAGNGTAPKETAPDEHSHVPGVSVLGAGEGKILADQEGAIKAADPDHGAATAEKDKEGKGLSRLWSKSRSSVDGRRRASVDETGKSPSGSRKAKSRFNEEPSTGSESTSVPGSPTSSRFKVPLKDKIKGELKIISGKMSKNEAKVEQGIALKTGHGHDAVSPK